MNSVITFTLPEILAFLGAAQCIYILVYMLVRSGRLSRATLPAIYFGVLACAFIVDGAYRFWSPHTAYYFQIQWLFWFAGPPLSRLIIIQIARITHLPPLREYTILLSIPIAYVVALSLSSYVSSCKSFINCPTNDEMLVIMGLVLGAFSILSIWTDREWLTGVRKQKGGFERFWLIIALVFLNVAFLLTMFLHTQGVLSLEETFMTRSFIGIAFAYTALTSLIRIYPQAMRLHERDEERLSDEDIAFALKIENLLHIEKIYQEPSYGRKELAGELRISEAYLSRIVNIHFEKSVPQLLNERRVEDAKALLRDTSVPVKNIFKEAGFNSLASFNRLFKEYTELTPTQYRSKKDNINS